MPAAIVGPHNARRSSRITSRCWPTTRSNTSQSIQVVRLLWGRSRQGEGVAHESPRQPQAPRPAPRRCATLRRDSQKHAMPLQCPRREGLECLPDAWRTRWRTLWPCQWAVATWRQDKGKRGHAAHSGAPHERGQRNRQGAGQPLNRGGLAKLARGRAVTGGTAWLT